MTSTNPRGAGGFRTTPLTPEPGGDRVARPGATPREAFLSLSAAHPEPCSYASAPTPLRDAFHAMLHDYAAPKPVPAAQMELPF